jgi:alanine-glyoxylate transaminase/serine-glyoxylate transaminase/serine-pyruvate transaminase
MLPPGLGFNAVSEKALAASHANAAARSYWAWDEMLRMNGDGYFPYTPSTTLLFGLREALALLQEQGLEAVFARHRVLAQATRAAVTRWGLEILCADPALHSPVLTAVLVPEGCDADLVRRMALERYNVSLGAGLGKVAGKVFRIGHLSQCNEPTLVGTLGAVEMALADAGVPHREGGVVAAMDVLRGAKAAAPNKAATADAA